MDKNTKIEIVFGRIFLIILFSFLTFLALEYFSRNYTLLENEFERLFPVDTTRYPKPYVMFSGNPNASELNNSGYRGLEPVTPKPAGEFRICMVGGSTVFNGNPPLPDLLESAFHKNGDLRIKVYNFGVVASVSGMDLARIVFEIADINPDLIVMYSGGNDIFMPWFGDPRPGYPINFIAYEANPILKDAANFPTIPLFFYGSHLLRSLFPNYFFNHLVPLKKTREEAAYLSEEWAQEIADIYLQNILKSAQFTQSIDSKLIAFFQPIVHYKQYLTATEDHYYKSNDKKYPLYMQKQIRLKSGMLKESNINFIDLSDIFKEYEGPVFTDHIHINQASKEVISDAIFEHVLPLTFNTTSQ